VCRGELLIAFESHFEDNGEIDEASARADGGHTASAGPARRLLAPPTVVSNHPWNHAAIDRTLRFDTRIGALQKVRADHAGEEDIAIGGRVVRARRYVVELWCGPDGTWLQSRFEHRGDAVTLTRQSALFPGAPFAAHRGPGGATLTQAGPELRCMPVVVCLLVLLASGGALAAEPAGDSYRYRIRHAVFGEIGEHQVVVRRDGDRLVVEHRAHLVVELLGVIAHERDSRYREVCKGSG
jgi:hypothetical protein